MLRCWVGGYVFSKEGVAFIVKGPVGAREDEGNTFLRKVGNQLPNGAPACPRRTESLCGQILVKFAVTCRTNPENTCFLTIAEYVTY